MTRWMRPHEIDRARERERFDPVVAGAHYRLPPELLLAIWERARADASDPSGRCDPAQSRQRFHDLAAQIAARGGRLTPDVGAVTRVGLEARDEPGGIWSIRELIPRIPGRKTLVVADAARSPAATILRSPVATAEDRTADHPSVADALGRRGEGELLPEALRREMERVLGADLRRVRIHTDAPAAEAALAIRARAFAIGEDIFFARGAFDPDGAPGRELLAHELVHVVQAQQGRIPRAPAGRTHVSEPGETMEQEAEQVARRVAAMPGASWPAATTSTMSSPRSCASRRSTRPSPTACSAKA
ncbi:MAG: DUF4157 domain-containing protein [Deltaproteobacteria bacterium]|nr:MAG: DUF4157 domain-containing protein [Deltaproteobacteria bacterium]TMQ19743.1 MAG: DUF4157 domain-containing protein [Deltaproteobacteria bacterium]